MREVGINSRILGRCGAGSTIGLVQCQGGDCLVVQTTFGVRLPSLLPVMIVLWLNKAMCHLIYSFLYRLYPISVLCWSFEPYVHWPKVPWIIPFDSTNMRLNWKLKVFAIWVKFFFILWIIFLCYVITMSSRSHAVVKHV